MPPIRILIVDDHPIMRVGITALIASCSEMETVAQAGSGEEAIKLHVLHHPDITLMDLRLPGISGVETIRSIRSQSPKARFIILTTYEGDEDIYRAMQAGAVTYLLKDTLSKKMMAVIREVAAGGRPITPEVARKLADRMFQSSLTQREVEVLHLVARGMRNKEVAAELRIGEETVQGHVKNILAKLGVHDRTEAVTVGIRRGIVHLG